MSCNLYTKYIAITTEITSVVGGGRGPITVVAWRAVVGGGRAPVSFHAHVGASSEILNSQCSSVISIPQTGQVWHFVKCAFFSLTQRVQGGGTDLRDGVAQEVSHCLRELMVERSFLGLFFFLKLVVES